MPKVQPYGPHRKPGPKSKPRCGKCKGCINNTKSSNAVPPNPWGKRPCTGTVPSELPAPPPSPAIPSPITRLRQVVKRFEFGDTHNAQVIFKAECDERRKATATGKRWKTGQRSGAEGFREVGGTIEMVFSGACECSVFLPVPHSLPPPRRPPPSLLYSHVYLSHTTFTRRHFTSHYRVCGRGAPSPHNCRSHISPLSSRRVRAS